MIWFTSDCHFGHKNVIKFCNRPFSSTEEMDKILIKNWNKKVKKNELIYVLGDFSFRNNKDTKNILNQLNGYKILVKGNHDKRSDLMLELGFNKVVENEKITIGNKEFLLSHFPYYPLEQHISFKGKILLYKIDKNADLRFLHKRILDDGKSILLHGHVHTSWKIKNRQINVGIDVWNYSPVSHEQILKIIDHI